ncbi:conserved hypothetical protein [Candidatus Sulfopaludibacter sp. SbA4]|nr:conserved hypothetical protein [Candidatus Sulfopaludibacter sp. SbA4]
MLVYPQLATGAMSQFPVKKQRRLRTVVNRAADGSSVKLADANGEYTEWTLQYTKLSDAELATLQQFFTAAEGTLNAFTFLDPASNLLAWTDQLNNAVWVPGPLLTVAGGVADPMGGTNAWHLTNTGAGAQNISQTISAPAGYLYCLSAYVRSAQAATATMLLGAQRATVPVTTGWTRIVFAASGDPTQASISFGLELPAGAAVYVYGMQAEPQAAASVYKSSTTGGVYENARLRDDLLTITSTDVNQHSCKVSIYYAKHL